MADFRQNDGPPYGLHEALACRDLLDRASARPRRITRLWNFAVLRRGTPRRPAHRETAAHTVSVQRSTR
jgi:hypothetical protein